MLETKPVGVLGALSTVGTRLDRTRITDFLGAPLMSIAEDDRAGGVLAMGPFVR
jgi:hypothetical protein